MKRKWMTSIAVMALLGIGIGAEKPKKPEKQISLDLGEGVSMKLVLIPAGRFTMGSPKNEAGRQDNEGPQRQVTISQPYYMGIHEVTYRQYEAVMGKLNRKVADPDLPINGVSWNSAKEFCERLSKSSKQVVTLPTEAQWEYACRAGSRTRYSFGNDERMLPQFARFGQRGNAGPLPVGSLKPNAWGLFDMHGNLAEWCSDFYEKAFPSKAETDPTGPKEGEDRVYRGGGWAMGAPHVRSACRGGVIPKGMGPDIGFRVVMRVPLETEIEDGKVEE
jgi:formylglycine-generating enzyme required for sulfatase activity